MSPPASRIASLDGLRGLAVMGILLMNAAGFALPSGAYFNPLATGSAPAADLAAWAVSFMLVDGKMRAIFSMLFGASTLIVVERAGADAARVHMARMATLALFGLAHMILLWQGDILLQYALVGVVALPFAQMEARTLIRVAVLLLIAQLVILAAYTLGFVALREAGGANWTSFASGVGVGSPAEVARQIAHFRGPWSGIAARAAAEAWPDTLFLLSFDGPETLAYMLIGMAALRSGFLSGGWSRARYLRTAALCAAIGLPPTMLLCWLSFRSGFDTIATFAAATLGGVPFRPVLGLGEAALALAWWGARESPLRLRIAAAGRAAFTNYLGTSLVMCALFYGWGLGLYARLDRLWLYPIILAVWALMLLWSRPWLARFRYGPMEWAWRSLARGVLQPMRRIDIASASQ